MGIENTYGAIRLAGSASVIAYSFDFKIFTESDIKVSKVLKTTNVATELTYPTEFAVAISATTEGGTVTPNPAIGTDYDILMELDLPFTQPTDIPNVGGVREAQLEDPYDRLTLMCQLLDARVGRGLNISVEDDTDISGFIPELTNITANALLSYTSDGKGITSTTVASLGAIALPAGTGIAVYTGSDTFINRTITKSGDIVVTNGDGISGNPVIDSSVIDGKIADFSSTDAAEGASLIGLEDSGGNYAAVNVEAALSEVYGFAVKKATGTFTSDGTNNRTISTGIAAGSTLIEVLVSNRGQVTYTHWHGGDAGSVIVGAGTVAMAAAGTTNFTLSGVDFIVGASGANAGATSVGWIAYYV